MKKIKPYIIEEPAKVEDTIRLFKISAKRVHQIEKWVREILGK